MRRSFGTVVLISSGCLMTLAAIGGSVAAVYGAVGVTELAAAVGLLGVVQLSIILTVWRRPSAEAARALQAREQVASAVDQDRADSHRGDVQQEPELGRPLAGAAEPADDTVPEPVDANAADLGNELMTTGIDLLDQGRLDLYLEPVVELTQSRTVYYRANLAITRQDGSRVGPYLLSLSARRGGYAPTLDQALFKRVCPVIRHLKARSRRPGVFCPLSPHSFAEPDVLDELIGFLQANKDAADAMVVEVSQPDLASLSPAGMEGLAYLAELGATLSLSEARLEGPDPETLVLLGFRFFDLDIAALASTHGWEAFSEDGEIRRLARRAEDAGLTVIAANVVRSEELERVRPFLRLARGALFSPPRIVRRDIAQRPAQAAAA